MNADQRFVQMAHDFDGGRNSNPQNWIRQPPPARQSSNLGGQQTPVRGGCNRAAKERHNGRRNYGDSFVSRARELGVALQLSLNARQQIFVSNRSQSHRNRIDEDHTISRAGEAAHQVGFRVWMVIPPILAAKTNDRLILQHR